MTQSPVVAPPPTLPSLAPTLPADRPYGDETDLRRLNDLTVRVTAVVGRARMEIGPLLSAGPGTVIELDRKIGESVDILVNDKLVARGDIVMIDGQIGLTISEILKSGD